MTRLDARARGAATSCLIALRWLPTGLLVPVIVLLAMSRGLSMTEIGLVFAIQGLVVLVLELPTGGLSDALGRRPVLILASLVEPGCARASSMSPIGRHLRRGDVPDGHLPRAGQRAARGLVRRRDARRGTRTPRSRRG